MNVKKFTDLVSSIMVTKQLSDNWSYSSNNEDQKVPDIHAAVMDDIIDTLSDACQVSEKGGRRH